MTAFHTMIRTLGLGIILTGAAAAALQPLTCTEFAAEALAAARAACLNLEENQICYGHPEVLTELTDPSISFEAPGDRAALDEVVTLTTSPYDADAGTWGIAYVRAVDADGVEIELMLFGGVTLVNDPEGLQLDIATDSACDGAPSGVIGRAASSEEITITINGETIPFSDVALAVLFPDGELETHIVDVETDDGITEDEAEGDDDVPASLIDAFRLPFGLGVVDLQTFETSSTLITPTSGTWFMESGSVALIEACPGEMIGRTRRPPDVPETAEFDFSNGISVEIFVEQLMGSVPPAEFGNPAPNIYTGHAEIISGPIDLTLTVISETEFIYSIVHKQVICYVQTLNWWRLQEE